MNIKTLTTVMLIVNLLFIGNVSAGAVKDNDVQSMIVKILPTEYAQYKKQLTGKNDINDCNAAFVLVSKAKAMLDKPVKERIYKTKDCKIAYSATWYLCLRMGQNSKDPAAQKLTLKEWNNSLIKDDNTVPYQIYALTEGPLDRSGFTDDFWKLLRQTNKKNTISAISFVLFASGDAEDINKLEEKRDSVTDPELKQIIQNAINWWKYRLSGDKTNPGPAALRPHRNMSEDY
jgi:hypothetical protein